MQRNKKWRLYTYLLTLKSKRSHPPDRAASVQWTKKSKMTTSPTMRFPIPDFYNFWQDFTKKSTHRNLLWTLMNNTQKDLQQRIHWQSRPNGNKSNNDPRPSLPNLCKSVQNFTKLNPQKSSTAQDLPNLKISGPDTKPRATTRRHKLAKTRGLHTRICEICS